VDAGTVAPTNDIDRTVDRHIAIWNEGDAKVAGDGRLRAVTGFLERA